MSPENQLPLFIVEGKKNLTTKEWLSGLIGRPAYDVVPEIVRYNFDIKKLFVIVVPTRKGIAETEFVESHAFGYEGADVDQGVSINRRKVLSSCEGLRHVIVEYGACQLAEIPGLVSFSHRKWLLDYFRYGQIRLSPELRAENKIIAIEEEINESLRMFDYGAGYCDEDDEFEEGEIDDYEIEHDFGLVEDYDNPPACFVTVSSRVILKNGEEAHIPMLDYRCPVSSENLAKIVASLRAQGQTGLVLNSGASYHFYGLNLIRNEDSWIQFLRTNLYQYDLVDPYFCVASKRKGRGSLRISSRRPDSYWAVIDDPIRGIKIDKPIKRIVAARPVPQVVTIVMPE